jgi:hypothetical protein
MSTWISPSLKVFTSALPREIPKMSQISLAKGRLEFPEKTLI